MRRQERAERKEEKTNAIDRPTIGFRSPFKTLLLFPRQLLDTNAIGVRREKMYQLDGHIGCAVAGITGEMIEQKKERERKS